MPFYTDYHVHSSFSTDCDTDMEIMIQKAIELKLHEIIFTDHTDYNYPNFNFEVDYNKYIPLLNNFKDKYKNEIKIKLGIEVGMQPKIIDKVSKLINKYPFDFVIASTHVVNGSDPYQGKYFNGKTQYEAYLEYFKNILNIVKNFTNYNVYGHLDYVIRYGNYTEKKYKYLDYADILDEILNTIIKNNRGIEVNTSGFRYGLNSPHPQYDLIKRYKKLGGKIITVGSDAHKPEDICADFDITYKILNEIGFDYITVFNNMQPKFVKI